MLVQFWGSLAETDHNDVEIKIVPAVPQQGVGATIEGVQSKEKVVHHVPNYGFTEDRQEIKATNQEHRDYVDNKFKQWHMRNELAQLGMMIPASKGLTDEEFAGLQEVARQKNQRQLSGKEALNYLEIYLQSKVKEKETEIQRPPQ